MAQRMGEDGRQDPQRTKDVWNGFMELVKAGKIQPVIYKEEYHGLEALPRALQDAQQHKSWGRAVLTISEEGKPTATRGSRL